MDHHHFFTRLESTTDILTVCRRVFCQCLFLHRLESPRSFPFSFANHHFSTALQCPGLVSRRTKNKLNKCRGQPPRSTLDSRRQLAAAPDESSRSEPTPLGLGAGAPARPRAGWAGSPPGTTRGTPDRFLVETVLAFPEASAAAPLSVSDPRRRGPSSPLRCAPNSHSPTRPDTPRGRGSDSQQPRRPAQRRHGHSHFQWRRLAPGLLRPRAPLLPRGKLPSLPRFQPYLLPSPLL